MNDKTLIIAHGDLDGVTSAALLAEQLRIESDDVNVVFTQPFLVDKIVIPYDIEKVYVVDIAINNRDPVMTEKFIAYLGPKLARWYDHHEGWSENVIMGGVDLERDVSDMRYTDYIINPASPACAAMLGNENDLRVMDAIAADTRKGELSPTGQLIERAVKSDMGNDQIRRWAVKLLMGDEDYRQPVEAVSRAYQAILSETYRLSLAYHIDGRAVTVRSAKMYHDSGKFPHGVIAFVDATDSNHAYDMTQLLLAGQELADFAVAKTINPKTNEEMVTVATKSGVNLVELFDLPSGAPFRVSLPAERLDEVIEKIQKDVKW